MKPQDTEMGMNVTGICTSPIHSRQMIEGAELGPITPGDAEAMASVQVAYMVSAEPVGTVPLPVTIKGAVETAVEMVKGKEPALFIDKLGERLSFERTGVRLYEGLLNKLCAKGSWEGGPTAEDLQQIHDDELAHFELVQAAMVEIGADPTAVTPAADVVGVEAMGIAQVIADPRTTLAQSVHAIFTAELSDKEGWTMLAELARAFGKEEMAAEFEIALEHEAEHVSRVRGWLACHVGALPGEEQEPEAAA